MATLLAPAPAAGLGHHWDRLLALLDDMAAAGVAWDAFTLSALMSACQAGGKWEQALKWFRRAQGTPGAGGAQHVQDAAAQW